MNKEAVERKENREAKQEIKREKEESEIKRVVENRKNIFHYILTCSCFS